MKHSYRAECDCRRCMKERERRAMQANINLTHHTPMPRPRRTRRVQSRRPIVGSQEWAETRGDDIDSPSGDY